MRNIREPVHQDDEAAYHIDEAFKPITEIGLPQFTRFGEFNLKYLAKRNPADLIIDREFLDGKPNGPVIVVFEVTDFIVQGQQGASVDLRQLLDPDVQLLTGDFANIQYRAPELLLQLISLNSCRVDYATGMPVIRIGNLDSGEAQNPIPERNYAPEFVVEDLTWNVLMANYLRKFGLPGNTEAESTMKAEVREARNRLLEALNKPGSDITEEMKALLDFSA